MDNTEVPFINNPHLSYHVTTTKWVYSLSASIVLFIYKYLQPSLYTQMLITIHLFHFICLYFQIFYSDVYPVKIKVLSHKYGIFDLSIPIQMDIQEIPVLHHYKDQDNDHSRFWGTHATILYSYAQTWTCWATGCKHFPFS